MQWPDLPLEINQDNEILAQTKKWQGSVLFSLSISSLIIQYGYEIREGFGSKKFLRILRWLINT